MRHTVAAVAVLLLVAAITGCATATRNNQEQLALMYTQGQYAAASESAVSASREMPLVLDNANIMFMAGKYGQAFELLEEAELATKDDDTENAALKAGKVFGEMLFNREFMAYAPRTCDKVLINTYKGLAQMALLNQQNARVEFNRAYDRQRRAVEEFAKEIEAEQKKLAEEKEKAAKVAHNATNAQKPGLDMDRTTESCSALVQEQMPEMNVWEAYPDFVNPYTTYLAGLFFALNGEMASDFGKAATLLKRVDEMVPGNRAVQSDVAMALSFENGASSPASEAPAVWVIFENGLAPALSELRLDLPIFLLNLDSPIKNVPFVLPRVKARDEACSHLVVRSGDSVLSTQEVASIDRVVQTEYKVRFPMLLTKALVATATKSFTQYLAEQAGGSGAGIVAAVFTTVSARADIRSWEALPKNVQVAKLPMPEKRVLDIALPDGSSAGSVELPESRFAIVHVRIPAPGAPAALNVIPVGAVRPDVEVAIQ